MSEQEPVKAVCAGEWLVLSDEEPGTAVPNEGTRWIATTQPVEAEQ